MSTFEIHIIPTLELKDHVKQKVTNLFSDLLCIHVSVCIVTRRYGGENKLLGPWYGIDQGLLELSNFSSPCIDKCWKFEKNRMMWGGNFDFGFLIYPCLSVHCDKRTYEKKSAVRPIIWHRYILKICEKENDVRCTFGWHHYTPPFLTRS